MSLSGRSARPAAAFAATAPGALRSATGGSRIVVGPTASRADADPFFEAIIGSPDPAFGTRGLEQPQAAVPADGDAGIIPAIAALTGVADASANARAATEAPAPTSARRTRSFVSRLSLGALSNTAPLGPASPAGGSVVSSPAAAAASAAAAAGGPGKYGVEGTLLVYDATPEVSALGTSPRAPTSAIVVPSGSSQIRAPPAVSPGPGARASSRASLTGASSSQPYAASRLVIPSAMPASARASGSATPARASAGGTSSRAYSQTARRASFVGGPGGLPAASSAQGGSSGSFTTRRASAVSLILPGGAPLGSVAGGGGGGAGGNSSSTGQAGPTGLSGGGAPVDAAATSASPDAVTVVCRLRPLTDDGSLQSHTPGFAQLGGGSSGGGGDAGSLAYGVPSEDGESLSVGCMTVQPDASSLSVLQWSPLLAGGAGVGGGAGVVGGDASTNGPSAATAFALTQHAHARAEQFTFDRVFAPDSRQQDVYEAVGAPVLHAVLRGFNGCILAYGQVRAQKLCAPALATLAR